MKEELHKCIVEPSKLNEDLDNFYLSKYLITELREFYTQRERHNFFKPTEMNQITRIPCKKIWPICYKALDVMKNHASPQTLLLKSQFLLSNFKFDHFSVNKQGTVDMYKTPSTQPSTAVIRIPDNELLIERQRHICDCRDDYYERMKSEVRLKISKQVANYEAFGDRVDKYPSSGQKKQTEFNSSDPYSEFILRNSMMPSPGSEYSHSLSNKASHDPHYTDTCKIA